MNNSTYAILPREPVSQGGSLFLLLITMMLLWATSPRVWGQGADGETPAAPPPASIGPAEEGAREQMQLEAVADAGGNAMRNYRVENVEVSQEDLDAVQEAPLLMDDAGVLPPETRDKILALLNDARENLNLSYYVHIVDDEAYDELYPQRAYALVRGELVASYGGVLVLSGDGGFLLHTSSSLLSTMLGADYVKNANTTATRQAALVALGAEQRIWTHVSSLIERLAVALEGSKPASSSSAAYLFGEGNPAEQGAEGDPGTLQTTETAPAKPAGNAIFGFLIGIGSAVLLFGVVYGVIRRKRKRSRALHRKAAETQGVEGSEALGSLPASKSAPQPKNTPSADGNRQFREHREKLAALLKEHQQQAQEDSRGGSLEQSPLDPKALEEVFTHYRVLLRLSTPASREGLRHGLENLNRDLRKD